MMNVIAEDVTRELKIEDETVVIRKQNPQDQKEISKYKNDDVEAGIEGLLRSVVSWTFKNSSGQPLAINRENICKIRLDIIQEISFAILKFNTPEKKKNA